MRDAVLSLSSLFLVYAGFIFILPILVDKKDDYDVISRYFPGERIRLFLGLTAALLAVLVFFFPNGNVIFLSDLLPFVLLLADAAILLMARIRSLKEGDADMLKRAQTILENLQIPLGFASLATGLLHSLLSPLPLL
jgi:hypothetical protein